MASLPLIINGAEGEGGGQILRTSLSLSCIFNRTIRIENIRAGRPNPGLQAQHLSCVNALQKITGAQTKGAQLHSTTLEFSPKEISGGSYEFDIGTAGSTTLLAEAIIPVLLQAGKKSQVNITGGTDVPFSPPSIFLEKVLLPNLGLPIKISTLKHGFYPQGGGSLEIEVEPTAIKPINIATRGKLEKLQCVSIASGLPSVAERQAKTIEGLLDTEAEIRDVQAVGKGSLAFVLAEYENCTNGFSSLGRIGKTAENVGKEAAEKFLAFDKGNTAVEEHLTDQLLLYMALAKGESEISGERISGHAKTNIEVIEKFLGKRFTTNDGKRIKASTL